MSDETGSHHQAGTSKSKNEKGSFFDYKLIECFFGIFFSYLVFGIIQEWMYGFKEILNFLT